MPGVRIGGWGFAKPRAAWKGLSAVVVFSGMSTPSTRLPVILDTDIGYRTDADDALALAYVLLQDECELLGVTTVGLRSDWRAELADVVCAQLGRDEVPVIAGADRPVCDTTYWFENPVQPWPADLQPRPRCDYPPNQAVDWLRSTIRDQPGRITLITIGQLTNLATLLLIDPEVADLLDAVIAMGGRIDYPPDQPRSECNIMLDPVAASIVFQRLGEKLTLVPIDAVRGHGLSVEQLDRMLRSPKLDPVRACTRAWDDQRKRSGLGLADPATVAVAFGPHLATSRNARVAIRLYDRPVPEGQPFDRDQVTGVTYLLADQPGPHRLVTAVDGPAIHEHLLEVFDRTA